MVIVAGLAVLPLTFNRMAIISLRGSGGILAAQWFDGPQAMLVAVLIIGGFIVTGATISTLGVVIMFFTVTSLSDLVAYSVYRARTRHWPPPEVVTIPPMLRQRWQISFVVISRLVLDWLVRISLSFYFSVAVVGQFRTAWQITSAITIIVTSFETVAGPRIAAAHRVGEKHRIRSILRQSVGAMSLLSAPLFIVMLGFPEWLLHLFGPEFPAAAPALRILALGQLVNILSGPLGSVMLMTGQECWTARISLASLLLLGIFCVTLIPAYGLVGAALTTSLVILFWTGVLYFLIRYLRIAR